MSVEDDVDMLILIRKDPIAALCLAVERAGLTMTLYGQAVDEAGLRAAAACTGLTRVAGEELTPEEVKAIASQAGETQ